MTIRTLSLIPLRSQPSTFSTNMEDLLSNLPGWTSEVNALGEDVTAKQITVSDAATTALTAIAGVNATKWVSGASYALNASVWSPLNFQPYRRKIPGADATDPSLDIDNIIWAPLSVPSQPRMYYSARTSNTALGFDDFGKLVEVTGGTFTQTFAPCATLTNGWWCYFCNVGSGSVTLDPDGAETIDGVANGVLKKGLYLIRCNGSSLSTTLVGPMCNVEIKTSGTSWVSPLGCKMVKATLISSGEGFSTAGIYLPGGASGSGSIHIIDTTPSTSYTCSIGAGTTGASNPSTIVVGGTTYSSLDGPVMIQSTQGAPAMPDHPYLHPAGGAGFMGYGRGAYGGFDASSFSSSGGSGAIILEY